MDILSLIGIVLPLACIAITMVMDGGNLLSLLQIPAFIIVIGATVGAMLLQTPLNVFLRGLRMLKWIWFPPKDDSPELVDKIMEWVRLSRSESILALEPIAEEQEDPVLRQGLQLLVDGVEVNQIRAVLETMIHVQEYHELLACEIFESMGGYAPTVGVLGAVLGLITVMAHLDDPSRLGSGIATAFVATVYGVGSANLLFLPVANKLRVLVRWRMRRLDMVLEAILGMAVMIKPIHLEMRLRSFLHDGDGQHAEPVGGPVNESLDAQLGEPEEALES